METLLSTGDAATLLQRSVDAVRMYERCGRLPALRTQGGLRLFRLSDVEKLAAELEKGRARP